MKHIKVNLKELRCDEAQFNKIEVEEMKKAFLKKSPIPSPWINKDNEVIAFHNSYFVAKELGFSDVLVVQKDD